MSRDIQDLSTESQAGSNPAKKRTYKSGSISFGCEVGPPQKRQRLPNLNDVPADLTNRLVVTYEPEHGTQMTPLSIQLEKIDANTHFPHQFRNAKRVLKALGSSASDLFWRHWMESEGGDLHTHTKIAMHKLIESWSFDMPNLSSSYSSSNVSPQFLKLAKILHSFEPHGPNFRGIVVVKHRSVAVIMAELLRYADETSDWVRPAAVTSCGDFNSDSRILEQFTSGTLNLLIVTTPVNDLHVIQPSVLLWYNLLDNPPQFCFHSSSTKAGYYNIYLAETGRKSHHVKLAHKEITPIGEEDFKALFGRRRNEFSQSTLDGEYRDDDETTFIQDPTTGRKLFPSHAKSMLLKFLPAYYGDETYEPSISLWEDSAGQHLCRVEFPPSLELDAISGPPKSTINQAERETCFAACRILHERGLLDYEFFPSLSHHMLHISIKADESQSAIATSGMRRHDKASPLYWSISRSVETRRLYPLLISIPGLLVGGGRILLLTRIPLPELPRFSVFDSGQPHVVRFMRCAPIEVNGKQPKLLHQYTLRLARALTNKDFILSEEELSYFVAPLYDSTIDIERLRDNKWIRPCISSHINWDAISLAAEQFMTPIVQEGIGLDNACIDAVIQDRWVEFTNRHMLIEIRRDLTPLSKNPDSPEGSSFLEMCKMHRKTFEGLKDESQPMLEVSSIPPLLDYLNPLPKPYRTGQKSRTKFLIPELCCKFTIPASTFRTAQFLPSITHRISDVLLAKQLNDNFFENRIAEHHLFEALFPPSAETESSYERLELLGDAYLKYAVSAYLFAIMPEDREAALHTARREIVCNKALYLGAVSVGLPAFMRVKPFLPRVWQPTLPPRSETEHPTSTDRNDTNATDPIEGSSKPKKGKRKKQQDELGIQWIGDKTVADVVEAIIGAAYLSGDRDLALRVSKRLKVAITEIDQWYDLKLRYAVPKGMLTTGLPPGTVADVERIVGYKFKRTEFLAQALTHGSKQQTLGYERLEFLGDAILDFYVVKHVFERYPGLSSGGLSMLKSAMVINTTLAAFCVISGLYKHVQHASHEIKGAIKNYSNTIKTLHAQELLVAEAEGRQAGQFWLEVPAPKILSDVVESVLGALFVSEEFLEVGTDAFFDRSLKPFFDEHIKMQSLSHHPSVGLYEWFQGVGCQEHQIEKTSEKNGIRCEVIVHDVILASAVDPAPTTARRMAALYALDALEGDPLFMTRTCNCRATRINKKLQKKTLGYEDDEESIAP